MKVLIDTNILISAALRPAGTPYEAYLKAVTFPNRGVVCEQNIVMTAAQFLAIDD